MPTSKQRLEQSVLLKLQRWNTPTIYNGWEQITQRDAAHECFNLEETHDFVPQIGPMAGYAVTVAIQPGTADHKKANPSAWIEYRQYIARVPGPKIVVVQDLDKPAIYGSFWGEVNASAHKALGCVGTITDGAVRDLDEMVAVGFKAIARRLCVGHAHAWPVQWDCEVQVFGTKVQPGQLIHADKHGFLIIPDEDQKRLLEAAIFMDDCELNTKISTAKNASGKSIDQIAEALDMATGQFNSLVRDKFG